MSWRTKDQSQQKKIPSLTSSLKLCSGSFDERSIDIDDLEEPSNNLNTSKATSKSKVFSFRKPKKGSLPLPTHSNHTDYTDTSTTARDLADGKDNVSLDNYSISSISTSATDTSIKNSKKTKMPSLVKKLRGRSFKKCGSKKAMPLDDLEVPDDDDVDTDATSTVNATVQQYREDQIEVTTGETVMNMTPSPTNTNSIATRQQTQNSATLISQTSSSISTTPSDSNTSTQKGSIKDTNDQFGPPSMSPDFWPQSPLIIRPTPGSGMIIKGIRYSNSTDYLHVPSTNTTGAPVNGNGDLGCPETCIIPHNNGCEPTNKSLVVDFESPLFVGTALVRIKSADCSSKYLESVQGTPVQEEGKESKTGYFNNVKRRHQVVIQGRFKSSSIPMTECVTGNFFHSGNLNLQNGLLVKAGLKLLRFVNPRILVKLDGVKMPYILSPLGSSPQVVIVDPVNDKDDQDVDTVDFRADGSIEEDHKEPIDESHTLLYQYNSKSDMSSSMVQNGTSTSRSTSPRRSSPKKVASTGTVVETEEKRKRRRKKAFDNLIGVENDPKGTPCFDKDKVYTFVFFQHHANFQKLEMCTTGMKSMNIGEGLGGSCLQIMSSHLDESSKAKLGSSANGLEKESPKTIWSFDLWHKKML